MNELYENIWKNKIKNKSDIEKGSRIDVTLSLLNNGKRILDVGCGDGTFLSLIKDRYEEVYGIDISETSLKESRMKNIQTKIYDSDKSPIPYPSNYMDTVACLDVIEHVFDPDKIISEIYRVLLPDGIFVVSCPNIRYWRHILSIITGEFPKTSTDTEHYDGGHIHYFTYRDIELILKKYGFREINKYSVFGKNICKEFMSPGVVIRCKK